MAAKVLGVLGGKDLPDDMVAPWLAWAEIVYAADSAADRCLRLGVPPVVVGDMDSMKSPRTGLDVRADMNQDSSDADKLLTLAMDEGHEEIVLAGLEGDRFDHVLASLSSILGAGIAAKIVLRRGLGYLGFRSLELNCEPDQRLSVIPICESRVTLEGVRWPLMAERLVPGGKASLSNRATGRVRFLCPDAGCLLVIEGPNGPEFSP